MRAVLAVLALSLVIAAPVTTASAAAVAPPSLRNVVRAAAVQQKQLSAAQAGCQIVTISVVSWKWAKLAWPDRMSAACMKVAANGVIIEHLVGGKWRFVTVGSDIRCPIKGMPAAVARDLQVCG